MELSQKLQQLPPQFFASLVKKVNAAIAEGKDIINLGQGNPDQPTPINIIEALKTASEDPLSHKYPPFRGIQQLKEAVAIFYEREYGVHINSNTEVAIMSGTKTGLVELPMALLNPGDYMLLPDPGYPDYLSGAVLAQVNYDLMPLLAENQFLPDYDAIPEEVKERAKLLYINYPNNPTGGTANMEFFNETVALAKKYNIGIVHDFAYSAIGYDGEKPKSFLQADGAKDVGIEMYTLSKTYNMAGWRIGMAVGNAEIIEAINLIQDHLFCSIFPGIQHAAVEALTGDQSAVKELQKMYERRRNVLIEACQRIGWNVQAPKGSFFAWLPVPEGYTSEQFTDLLLDQAHVAVASGNGFGEYGEGYVRIGLLVSEERLVEAVERIEKLGLFTKAKSLSQK